MIEKLCCLKGNTVGASKSSQFIIGFVKCSILIKNGDFSKKKN